MQPSAPKALALILAKKKPGGEMDKGEDMGGDDYVSAAQDVMDAMKAGDAEAFASAMRSFVSMCMDMDHEEPEGDEG